MRRILKWFDLSLTISLLTILLLLNDRIEATTPSPAAQPQQLLSDVQIPRNDQTHWKFPALSSRTGATTTLFQLQQQVQAFDERISNVIADNILRFAHDFGTQLMSLDPYSTQSEIFSPLSIMSALSQLMLGAKGKSYQELKQLIGLDTDAELSLNPQKFHKEFGVLMEDVQHYKQTVDNGLRKRLSTKWRSTNTNTSPIRSLNPNVVTNDQIIKVANGLFVQAGYNLNPDYKQVIQSTYDSDLQQLDFHMKPAEARDHINEWVRSKTFGKIPNIMSGPVDPDTNMIMAAAVYFRGFWENSFFPKATAENNFFQDGPDSPPIKVQMMATGGVFPFYESKEYDCRIIGLPYKGNETTMYVIQPNQSTRQKLRQLQQKLDAPKINEMIDKMIRKTTVMVFPKMHFTRTIHMKSMLESLGVLQIFQRSYSDLSLIADISAAPANHLVGLQFASPPVASSAAAPTINRFPGFISQQQFNKKQYFDRYDEPALVFTSRFGEVDDAANKKDDAAIKVENKTETVESTTSIPSTTTTTTEKSTREKRQAPAFNINAGQTAQALANIESDRIKLDQNGYRADLYVDEIVHKVDFAVDEQGTEAAAATLVYLHRSGTDVVFRGDTPFLLVIRHDPTKLPLFYGIINKPEL